MFSGIVETTSTILNTRDDGGVLRIIVKKPDKFNDLDLGDSIACDGICLTLEACDEKAMQFAVAAETLQVTGWNGKSLKGNEINLERSLKYGDRVHGHIVTGHVDELGTVEKFFNVNGSWMLDVQCSKELSPLVWKKGSIAINGVSLTVNEFKDNAISVCLIPETYQRTNLKQLKPGDRVCLEADNIARGLNHQRNLLHQGEVL